MNDVDYQINLEDALEKLPDSVQDLFPNNGLVIAVELIADDQDLIMADLGEIYEAIRQIITKELPPENFEAALREKFSEDNREKAPAVAAEVTEQIFGKLLPALGIKSPETGKKPTEPRGAPVRIAAQTPIYKPVAPSTSPSPSPIPNAHLQALLTIAAGSNYSQKELRQKFETLPALLQDSIISIDSARRIENIGRKYGLHVDKIGELGVETGLVLMGLTHPSDFVSRLRSSLGAPENTVVGIAKDINGQILLPIRDELKMVHGENRNAGGKARPASAGTQTVESGYQEEDLDREKILREIENPIPISPYERPVSSVTAKPARVAQPQSPIPGSAAPVSRPGPQKPTANFYQKPVWPSAPTGAAAPRARVEPKMAPPPANLPTAEQNAPVPPRTVPIRKEMSMPPANSANPREQRGEPFLPPAPKTAPQTTTFRPRWPAGTEAAASPESRASTPPAPAFKPRPPQPAETEAPLQPKPPTETGIIGQKLSGAVKTTREESRYSLDPYREPAE